MHRNPDEYSVPISRSYHSSGTLNEKVDTTAMRHTETRYAEVKYQATVKYSIHQFMVMMSTWGENTTRGWLTDSMTIHILTCATERVASC